VVVAFVRFVLRQKYAAEVMLMMFVPGSCMGYL
jgi:hypothetical protein